MTTVNNTTTNTTVVVKRIHLLDMPFDFFDVDNNAFVHATGDRVLLSDGSWHVEYEDSIFTDAPDVEEEWEEEEEYEEEYEEEEWEQVEWKFVLNGLAQVIVNYGHEVYIYNKIDDNKWEEVFYASDLFGQSKAGLYTDDYIIWVLASNINDELTLKFE